MTQNNLSCDSSDCASKKSKCCGADKSMDFQSEYSLYGDFLRFRTKDICDKCKGPFRPKECTCKLQMKYEYNFILCATDEIDFLIKNSNELGKEGWKMCGFSFNEIRMRAVFIREIKE